MNETPRYQHDCEKCVYLGRGKYSCDETAYSVPENDLYWCPNHVRVEREVLVRRFGPTLAPGGMNDSCYQRARDVLREDPPYNSEAVYLYTLAAERACRKGLISKLEVVMYLIHTPGW